MAKGCVYSLALALLCVCALAAPAAAQWTTNGELLSGATFDQRGAVAVSDGAGGAIIVWEDYRDGMGSNIYAQRVDAGGNMLWMTDGMPITDGPNYEQSCRIVSDGAGGAIIVWQDDRMGNQDIYAQRVDADGNVLWTTGGEVVCGHTSDQWEINAISDDAGGAIISWNDYRDGNGDIYAQRLDGDGNALWEPDGLPIVSLWSDQYSPKICPDRSGGAIIAWSDWRNSTAELYAQRIGSDGLGQWEADGVSICPGRYQNDFSFMTDGSSVYFAWQEYNGMYDDIFLQRLDMNGDVLWASEGLIASTYWSYKYNPQIVDDVEGGAIVAWYDSRGDNYSVYAQRLNPDTGIVWDEEGVMVYNTAGNYNLRMVADGMGGAIVPLDAYDWENDEYNIYVQRIDGNGVLRWSLPDGTPVCKAEGEQYAPVSVNDGMGGVIIAWEDYRSYDDADLYVQRIGPSGLWGDPAPEIISCLDVPKDQGGWVRVKTRASALDVAGELASPILGYSVWRLIDAVDDGGPMAALSSAATEDPAALLSILADPEHAVGVRVDAASAALLGLPEGEWESVGFWFAMRDTVYNIAVPTRNDSTAAGIPWEVYMVTAHTTTAGVFVPSLPDTGYSVDNLAPGLTEGFVGNELASPAGLLLSWNTNPASDLASYDVYRGLDALFAPDASNLLASTEGTEYLDDTWVEAYDYYYKLVAVDRHGNESPAALLAPGDVNVGTLLQSYAAALTGSFVEIAWTLSEIDADASFAVLRAEGAGAPYTALPSVEITREGLSFSFVDRSIEPGTIYIYRVDVVGESGSRTLFETQAIVTPEAPLTLQQNHPNPFNPSTTINYYLPAASPVTLEVFDASGRLVSRLLGGVRQERGVHTIEWRGVDDGGRTVSSGVYFYRLKAGRETLTRKMVLLR